MLEVMRRGEGVEHSMAVHVYALGCDLDSTSAFSPCDDILKIISVLSQNYFFTGCIFLKKSLPPRISDFLKVQHLYITTT